MPTIPERLETATSLVEVDSGLLNSIVHGASTDPDVTTDGGAVKPIAKVVAEGEAATLAMIAAMGLYNRVAMPTTSGDPGAVGDFAVNGDELAIYVTATGWRFLTLFSK